MITNKKSFFDKAHPGFEKIYPQNDCLELLNEIVEGINEINKIKNVKRNKEVENKIIFLFYKMGTLKDWVGTEQKNLKIINKKIQDSHYLAWIQDFNNTLKHKNLTFTHNKTFYNDLNYLNTLPQLYLFYNNTLNKKENCTLHYYLINKEMESVVIAQLFDVFVSEWRKIFNEIGSIKK